MYITFNIKKKFYYFNDFFFQMLRIKNYNILMLIFLKN